MSESLSESPEPISGMATGFGAMRARAAWTAGSS